MTRQPKLELIVSAAAVILIVAVFAWVFLGPSEAAATAAVTTGAVAAAARRGAARQQAIAAKRSLAEAEKELGADHLDEIRAEIDATKAAMADARDIGSLSPEEKLALLRKTHGDDDAA
jgi:hypothetical protein